MVNTNLENQNTLRETTNLQNRIKEEPEDYSCEHVRKFEREHKIKVEPDFEIDCCVKRKFKTEPSDTDLDPTAETCSTDEKPSSSGYLFKMIGLISNLF